MKNKLAFICLLFLAFFSVSSAFAQDSTSIKITLPDSEKWSTDSVKIYNFLHDKWTFFDKIDTTVNSCFVKFPCKRAIEQEIYLGENKGFYLLTLSNDTIEIVIDEEGKPTFLKGKTYRENQITYNMYSYPKFDIEFWFNNSPSPIDIHALDILFHRNDSTLRSMIESCDTSLKQIDVDSTFDKYFRNQLAVHKYQMNEDKSIFKNKIDKNYPYAKDYVDLLYEQILEENCTKPKPKIRTNKYYACAYEQIKQIKNEKIRNYLSLNVLPSLMYHTLWWNDDEEKVFYEVMEEVKKAFPNNEKVKINEQKAISNKRYARGALAPDFTLTDLVGKEVSLSDFGGKYVFITFWDSTSKIYEYNTFYGNQILEKFTEKEVIFVFVAINQTEEEWKEVLYNEESIGIHLFADAKQLEDLKKIILLMKINLKLLMQHL